jgi:DNA-binding NarL/FixJ family response regulator
VDQLIDNETRRRDHVDRLLSGLADGLFVVDSRGEVLCVLQDVSKNRRPNNGMIAAFEAVIADTSAIGRSLMEKFAALRRGSVVNGGTSELDQLSVREREVLGLICQGQDDREMTRTLGLSRNTVRNHIAALYRKIGVNRRSAAIIWARERGITSDEALKPRPGPRPPHRAARH